MKLTPVLGFALLNLTATPSAGQNTLTSANLLTACTTPDMHWVDFCNGYFQAVHDALAIVGLVCAPPGTTRTNLVEVFEVEALRIIATDPAMAELPGHTLGAQILQRTMPCN